MPDPRVSAVVPTYNRCEEVFRCVQTILDSSHRNLELLIVDKRRYR